jgi:hypothetical protein
MASSSSNVVIDQFLALQNSLHARGQCPFHLMPHAHAHAQNAPKMITSVGLLFTLLITLPQRKTDSRRSVALVLLLIVSVNHAEDILLNIARK